MKHLLDGGAETERSRKMVRQIKQGASDENSNNKVRTKSNRKSDYGI